jgi:putative transposase
MFCTKHPPVFVGENQAIGIETLSVHHLMKNHPLAQAIADQGFGLFFTLMKYKEQRPDTQLIVVGCWFPSGKLCSTPGCDYANKTLTLKDRQWTCPACGITHDRDHNTAINLQRLVTVTALPVATDAATHPSGLANAELGGKVTPVRDEVIPAGSVLAASGQEEIGDHCSSPIL